MNAKSSVKKLLKNKNFLALWLGHTASTFGDVLYTVGVMWFVFQDTGSAFAVAGIPIAEVVAKFIFGSMAGPLVDRWNRRYVIMISNLLKASMILLITLLHTLGLLTPMATYFITFGLATIGSFYGPARGALLPNVVNRVELTVANSFSTISERLVRAISWGLGGAAIAAIGLIRIAWINAIVFLVAAGAVWGVRVSTKPKQGLQHRYHSVLHDLWDGIRFFQSQPILRNLMLVSIPGWLTISLWSSLVIVFLNRTLKVGAASWGMIQASFFFAGLIGSLVTPVVVGRIVKEGRLVISLALFSGLLTIAFGQSGFFIVAVMIIMLAGFFDPFALVARASLLQAYAPDQFRGRALSVWGTILALFHTVSYILSGILADLVDIRFLYLGGGLIYLTVGLIVWMRSPLKEAQVKCSE